MAGTSMLFLGSSVLVGQDKFHDNAGSEVLHGIYKSYARLQQRALLTYIKRVYYPFLVRDPELIAVGGHLCALWLHSLNCSRTASVGTVVLGLAVVIPSLKDLPAALDSLEDLILQSGELKPHASGLVVLTDALGAHDSRSRPKSWLQKSKDTTVVAVAFFPGSSIS